MKKIISFVSAGTIYLSLAIPAFAQKVELCPKDPPFNVLCSLTKDSTPNIISVIITILFIAAVVIALIFLIYGGIKWILSGGDKTNVEAARNHIIAAIVGLIIALGAYLILNIILKTFLGTSITEFTIPRM